MAQTSVAARLKELLSVSGGARFDEALQAVAGEFGAVTATLHRADADQRMLHMVSHLGLPEPLIPITAHIPFGKGIAGLCAERQESVTLCNLQTDDSGAARPSAKQTGVAGAISVPIFDASGTTLLGTLGVGKPGEHTYTDDEQRVLAECARLFGQALTHSA
jgi:GAF domain-containing protein